jgi:import inner membrane translocase subunit TIM10
LFVQTRRSCPLLLNSSFTNHYHELLWKCTKTSGAGAVVCRLVAENIFSAWVRNGFLLALVGGGCSCFFFTLAKTEVELYADLFNKVASQCFDKCMSRKHKTLDLELGEMSCMDRCVAKYLESQEKVGLLMQKFNDAAVAQQQSMEEIQAQLAGKR